MPQDVLFPQGRFDAKLELIPQEPGVYLMKDASGSVIYVGKAIDLPRRLRSYFCEHPQGNAKVLAMISHIADFDYLLCSNELEALILENNLIKQYQPHYNILLRDDKEYPYLKVSMQEAYPRVLRSFHIETDQAQGARYFGPYLAGDLHRALQAIYAIFPLKRCRRILPRDIGKERPCLLYHIGRCIGPCKGDVSADDYYEVCSRLCRFLEGQSADFAEELQASMQQASDDLRFEEAARLRDRLQALERLQERQVIVSPERKDTADVLGTARNQNEFAVQILKIREGRILSSAAFFFPDRGESEAEILEAFLLQYYREGSLIPAEILMGSDLENVPILEKQLSSLKGHKAELRAVRIGRKKRWLEMAEKNAEESLHRHTLLGGIGEREESLRDLAERLGIKDDLRRIEAYDIANLGSDDRAASMVVFENGKPLRSAYRHFKIENQTGIDDYAAMREVIARRLARLDDPDFGESPQLILLDGGKTHLTAVAPLLRDTSITLAAMVKDDRHRSRGLVRDDQTILELRHDPREEEQMNPNERARDLSLLRLLTAIQNEAHRFAGRLQKNLGRKRNLRWSLEEIPGIGPSRRRAILSAFKNLKAVAAATIDELKAVPGLPEEAAAAVYHSFHPEEEA